MTTLNKNATTEEVQELIKVTTKAAPESRIGSDKANRSGAPSLRYGNTPSTGSDTTGGNSSSANGTNTADAGTTNNSDTTNSGKNEPSKGQLTVIDVNKDGDGVTHFDGTGNTGTKIQYNGALNQSLVAQQNVSGALLNRFRYRATGTYTTYANGNVKPPFGGSRLADNEAQPYRILNVNNYEFGLGVVDNAGGSQKDSSTVKLTQVQPDGSAVINLGLPDATQVVEPSLWLAVSLADLSTTDKSVFNSSTFIDQYEAGFEIKGAGVTTTSFTGKFETSATGVVLTTNIGGMAIPENASMRYTKYTADSISSGAAANEGRPFQGYVGVVPDKDTAAATFPNNPSVYFPESQYTAKKSSKYALVYGDFTVRMYITHKASNTMYEMTFPLTVKFNPKS